MGGLCNGCFNVGARNLNIAKLGHACSASRLKAEMHYEFEYPKGKPLRLCAITQWGDTADEGRELVNLVE